MRIAYVVGSFPTRSETFIMREAAALALDRGATSTFEEWGVNGSWRWGEYRGFLRSLSHAWSAHPAEFLIRNLIGLEILEPGCRKVRLAPRAVPFDYQVAYPTPRGPIAVASRSGKTTVGVPEGIEML